MTTGTKVAAAAAAPPLGLTSATPRHDDAPEILLFPCSVPYCSIRNTSGTLSHHPRGDVLPVEP